MDQRATTSVSYAIVGAVLGHAVNKLNVWAIGTALPPALSALMKLAVLAVVLAGVQWMSPGLGSTWQRTTPGLFFAAMYFGTQPSLMADVGRLQSYEVNED